MKRSRSSKTGARRRKAMGVHYTPPELAEFLADRLVENLRSNSESPLRILDPACGDGVLLGALLAALEKAGVQRDCDVVGVEANPRVVQQANSRIATFEQVHCRMIPADFLELAHQRTGQAEFWEAHPVHPGFDRSFDMIIANPPYVRTQVLGAAKAQRLAARYGLTGRVDLYHAFFVAATETLRPGGLLGIITSNRFLSTAGGRSIRRYLAQHYEIQEVIDLGDTKLFEAAVLPAIFIGRRRTHSSPVRFRRVPRFLKVYSQAGAAAMGLPDPTVTGSIYNVLKRGQPGCYRVPDGVFKLARGDLVVGPDPSEVWRLTTDEETAWLDRVRRSSYGLFGDVATVRVGIKTTADEVFIRSCWKSLPMARQPEGELLRDLLRHEEARRWSLPESMKPSTRVLYPHEISLGRRQPVDLNRYPRARSYLESYRKRLEQRRYVLEAGRQWYEIWVPQNPDGWAAPKIVFPDISPDARFYLDLDGRIVDGDCYWMALRPGVPRDMLYLLLAIANSAVIAKYHDLAFHNKLYSARRRYITQYVAKYPFPDPASGFSRRLIRLSKELVRLAKCDGENESKTRALSNEVDLVVESAFGLRTAGIVE